MTIKIIPFKFCHYKELIKMLQEISSFYPDHSYLESIYKEFISQENLYSIVALSGKEVVGFGSIFFFKRVRGGKEGIIEDLIVSRNYRKLGIGSKILKKLISEAKVQKCFKICLESNNPSVDFYSKEGFLKGGLIMKYFI
tara:strand:+ start:2015 stop:2434 length:420 start_codon:yes stop_codon:yes gene_type:complete